MFYYKRSFFKVRTKISSNNNLVALYGTKLHTGLVAGRLGHVLHRRVTTGEVMSISTSDANTFGATLEATGRALGALLTFGGVVVLMYTSAPELATLVLVQLWVRLDVFVMSNFLSLVELTK